MTRRTIIRIAAPILALGVAVAVAVGAYQLGKPATPSATLVVGGGSGGGGAPVCSMAPHKGADGLRSYPTSCGEGAAIVATYGKFVGAYNQVLDNPYGNDNTPRQELGAIYDQEASGKAGATALPPGCTIPAPSTHAVSWPKACDPLLSKGGVGDPLAPVATALGGITTPGGTTHMLRVLSVDLNAGYATSGSLEPAGKPVIREIVPKGGTIFATAPAPGSPVSAWAPGAIKVPATSAVVWSCLADHLVTTNSAGQHGPTTGYWAMSLRLALNDGHWLVGGWGVQTVPTAITKGTPCGSAY